MAAQSTASPTDPLPAGSRLEGYTIQHKISGGGFGLVYLAHDEQGQAVALKEYLPVGVVARQPDGGVQPITEAEAGADGIARWRSDSASRPSISSLCLATASCVARSGDCVRSVTLPRRIGSLYSIACGA